MPLDQRVIRNMSEYWISMGCEVEEFNGEAFTLISEYLKDNYSIEYELTGAYACTHNPCEEIELEVPVPNPTLSCTEQAIVSSRQYIRDIVSPPTQQEAPRNRLMDELLIPRHCTVIPSGYTTEVSTRNLWTSTPVEY